MYLDKVRQFVAALKEFQVRQIPLEENAKALTHLAAAIELETAQDIKLGRVKMIAKTEGNLRNWRTLIISYLKGV